MQFASWTPGGVPVGKVVEVMVSSGIERPDCYLRHTIGSASVLTEPKQSGRIQDKEREPLRMGLDCNGMTQVRPRSNSGMQRVKSGGRRGADWGAWGGGQCLNLVSSRVQFLYTLCTVGKQ